MPAMTIGPCPCCAVSATPPGLDPGGVAAAGPGRRSGPEPGPESGPKSGPKSRPESGPRLPRGAARHYSRRVRPVARFAALFLAIFCSLAAPGATEPEVALEPGGEARAVAAIDGDTLRLEDGREVRLV